MKVTSKFILPILCIVFMACSSSSDDDLVTPPEEEPKAEDVTYEGNIKAIINSKCIGCHSDPPSNGAPFALTTFDEVKNRSGNVFSATNNGSMPPAGKLPQADIDLISAWIDGGLKN